MIEENFLSSLPNKLKTLVGVYVIVLSFGFSIGLLFIQKTTSGSFNGIVEHYNGNEDDEEAVEMKFKKSMHEMMNIVHTHILGISTIFFTLSLLVFGCTLPSLLKSFLMIEPLLSLLTTFGSIYMIWKGYEWFSLVVLISGGLMAIGFWLSVLIVLINLRKSARG